MKQLATYLLCLLPVLASGQFAPPAGEPGTTAIHKDSSIFIGWAAGCTISAGLRDIAQPDSGYADAGDSSLALGAPDGATVSLGDHGVATLTFTSPIKNETGWDFAVFENGFNNTFLELAFVEVSSDGNYFVRFPATSLTQDTIPVGSFGSVDATKINNLAGKYRATFGTPFDLGILPSDSLLDINRITHLKIIDVVGSLDPAHATYDQHGNKLNDPYPTLFPSSGFDLDAVGVIHQIPTGIDFVDKDSLVLRVYPNPVHNVAMIEVTILFPGVYEMMITDMTGRNMAKESMELISSGPYLIPVDIGHLGSNVYALTVASETGQIVHQLVVKQ